MNSLRARLFLLSGGLVTAALLMTAVVIYLQVSGTVKANVEENGTRLVEKEKQYIEQYLEEFEHHLMVMSEDPVVIQFLQEKNNNDASFAEGWTEVEESLLRFSNQYKDVELLFTGAANTGVNTAPVVDVGDMDATTRPWYEAGEADPEQIGWTEPYISEDGGEYVVSAAKAILDPSTSEVIGVLGMDISLAGLAAMLSEIDVEYNGYMTLLDKDGNAIVHPEFTGEELADDSALRSGLDKENGQVAFEENGQSFELFHDKISLNGWMIGSVYNSEAMGEEADMVRDTIILIAIAAIILSLTASYFAARRITKPVREIQERVNRFAKGDISVQFPQKSYKEINQLSADLNKMTTSIRQLVLQIEETAKQVSSSAEQFSAVSEETSAAGEEVAHAVNDIAGGAQVQAEEAENTKQEMGILTTAFMYLQDSIKDIASQTELSSQLNERGVQEVSDLEEKTTDSREMMNKVEDVFSGLSNRLKEIEQVMASIGDIADQTNLLALNASIEAARAGEQGKGFAVVAEEVRKLADQSNHSAAKVQKILANVSEEAGKVKTTVSRSREVGEAQQQAMNNVKNAFTQMKETSASITTVTAQLQQEIPMMEERRAAVEKAIERMAEVAESNAASAEQVSASADEQKQAIQSVAGSSEELNEESAVLIDLMKQFKQQQTTEARE
ncbi:methyl-accepting chemotaxis protein [Alteribacillus sp. HJP-4]|uniref:methyl-accepting chemotaxis protein n=1 Tax=Alteribacillus sp. HJP-4 TaxID=2775394 RepID=UPI0035CD3334